MKTQTSILIILFIFAITYILCVISNQNTERSHNWDTRFEKIQFNSTHRNLQHIFRNSRNRFSINSGRPNVLVAPLFWDVVEGAYMITLRVGKSDVEFVLDTGSSQLSAKGTGCLWENCTGDTCTTIACPCGFNTKDGKPREDCRKHYYIPTGKALKPGEQGAGTSTKLKYGSQEDTVAHFDDTVALKQYTITCEQLQIQPVNIDTNNYSNNDVYHSLGNIVVHRVSKIEGSSSSNLLGLSQPPDIVAPESGQVVIDKLFGGRKSQWNLILRPTGGWWTLGPPAPCFKNVKYVPLVNPSEFNLFLTKFYIIPIRSISVSVGTTMRKISKTQMPKYCLVDTGTTLTYGSTRLGHAMMEAGWQENVSLFEIEFGNKEQHITVTYSAAQLADPENPQFSVIQVEQGRTLDDFDSIFPKDSCLLFGILMMQNMMWCFDLANNRMGIHPLK